MGSAEDGSFSDKGDRIMSRLASPLQIDHLQNRFTDLNPGADVDRIDWRATIDATATMGENFEIFAQAYPEFNWELEEDISPGRYAALVIEGLQDEAEPYGYELIKARQLEGLQRQEKKAKKLRISLEECKGLRPERKKKRKKITCQESAKVETCFLRCPRP